MMKEKIKVYLASPYSNGGTEDETTRTKNTYYSLQVATQLVQHGFNVFAPLLAHFWDNWFPMSYATWVEIDLDWMYRCDCLLRIDGESEGADKEILMARELKIPVFYNITDLFDYYFDTAKCDLKDENN